MTKPSTDEILNAIGEMSVMNFVNFRKKFEEYFEVSAIIVPVEPPPSELAAAEEEISFTVRIMAIGQKKIEVIKELRALTSISLREAKDLIESAPQPVLEDVSQGEADKAQRLLERAGATIEVS